MIKRDTVRLALVQIQEELEKNLLYIKTKKDVITNRRLYLLSNKEWKVEYIKYVNETKYSLDVINKLYQDLLSLNLYVNQIKGLIETSNEELINDENNQKKVKRALKRY